MRTKVRSAMTTKPISVSPEDNLSEAVELLIEEKIGGIPVVDEEQRLVGIVAHLDMLRCFLGHLPEE